LILQTFKPAKDRPPVKKLKKNPKKYQKIENLPLWKFTLAPRDLLLRNHSRRATKLAPRDLLFCVNSRRATCSSNFQIFPKISKIQIFNF
jgi:hypothetical protein